MTLRATRYEQVADRILNLINNGVLKEGEKIPSIRQLSHELGVSINTVKEAYWKLENQNYIIAVPQSGFYVQKQLSTPSEQPMADPCDLDPDKISLCQVYGTFQNTGRCTPEISLGISALNPRFWPTEKIERYFQEAMRDQEYDSFNYLMSPGYLSLREQISRIGLSSGLNLSPEDIIITNGCHEAIFLAMMVLCKPGDTVVFESPIYFNMLQLLEQLNLRIIEIPSSYSEGISLDTLRFVLDNHDVTAMFTISNFNNPMGFSLSKQKKQRMIELLKEYEVPLVEDDIYGDISFTDRPDTCKTYDQEGDVILCSSFSKTISPGLRVGWIVPGKYYSAVLKMKILLNISTASMNQIAVAKFLNEGGYERHLRKLRKKIKEQVFTMRASILKHFPNGTKVTNPEGGFMLWITLPDSADSTKIYQKAIKKNILIAPGNLFSVKDQYSNCMRLNAGVWNDDIEKAIGYLGELCSRG